MATKTKTKTPKAKIHAMRYRKTDGVWVVKAAGAAPLAEGEDKRALLAVARQKVAKERPSQLDIYGKDDKLQTTVKYK